jgi:hypothetical protein
MVNKFNEQATSEGKTEVVHAGDPDGTLFLINPDVSPEPSPQLAAASPPLQHRRAMPVQQPALRNLEKATY